MLSTTYSPSAIETSLTALWSTPGFLSDFDAQATGDPYCIMMPPANVTGSLHMGHALTYSLQDVMIRFHRMLGRKVLWQPGVDHAGIATQMVVERQLNAQGIKRHDLGREAFLERVWAWKHESGNAIVDQLKRLGTCAPWERGRFTMDDAFNTAVIQCFVTLYEQGLIYRAKRLVNWDIHFQTAISDLEVESREEKGHLWHINYTVQTGPHAGSIITVATTRPETLFGDTAVAVHPDDERYQHLIGATVLIPLANRSVPIIADTYCDPAKGTGCVKITPAHDFNDFHVGKRHNLEALNIFTNLGALSDDVPDPYRGLDRFVARSKVIADLESLGALAQIVDITHSVPYGDRSGVVVEPWMTDQWFVDAATLSVPALKAVEDGVTRFVPDAWKSTYFDWLTSIEPWCISRQIWWGHRIPAWYAPLESDPTGATKIFVATTQEAAYAQARAYYAKPDVVLEQDTDVLDTWFSSALWPFVTLGWPEKTPDLATYYPTQVLVTGFDIIFFWVARMMMMGIHFTGAVPFKEVYIHPLVRDDKGQKMSKSKGNVINPLETLEKYGADALRFTLVALSVQGRDIKLSEGRIEGYRNFLTKLWNMARYTAMNGCTYDPHFQPEAVRHPVNQWIVGETHTMLTALNASLAGYKFNEAANGLYHFIWGTLCDWYIEFSKPLMDDATAAQETRACVAWCLSVVLKALHPVCPFITDTLGGALLNTAQDPLFSLSKLPWPQAPQPTEVLTRGATEITWLQGLISEIRALKSECGLAPGTLMTAQVSGASPQHLAWLSTHGPSLAKMARIKAFVPQETLPQGLLQMVYGGMIVGLEAPAGLDIATEKERLAKKITTLTKDLNALTAKLSSTEFTRKAPPEVVAEHHARKDDLTRHLSKTQQIITGL